MTTTHRALRRRTVRVPCIQQAMLKYMDVLIQVFNSYLDDMLLVVDEFRCGSI